MVHMTVICSHISGKWHIRLQVTAVVCCKLSFKAVVIRHSIQGVMDQQPCMVHCKVTVWSFGFLVQEQGGGKANSVGGTREAKRVMEKEMEERK